MPGFDLQPVDARHLLAAVLAVGRSPFDPIEHFSIVGRPLGNTLPTTVAHGRGRFEQEEAVFRPLPVDARLLGLGLLGRQDLVNPPVDDPGVVLARIDGVQREFEALLALDAAVATGAVAAALGEDSPDVPCKAEGWRFLCPINAHAGPGPQLSHFGVQFAFPVRSRRDPPHLVERCEPRLGEREMALPGHVAFQAVGKRPQDQKPLSRTHALQTHPLRNDAHRHDGGGRLFHCGGSFTGAGSRSAEELHETAYTDRNQEKRGPQATADGSSCSHGFGPLMIVAAWPASCLRRPRHFLTTMTGNSATRKAEPDFSPTDGNPHT